jgi:hypothetical protein
MRSKPEFYIAKAKECEGRAQEMPPAFWRTFLSLAAHWRKLASNAAEADGNRIKKQRIVGGNSFKKQQIVESGQRSVDTRQPTRLIIFHRLFAYR